MKLAALACLSLVPLFAQGTGSVSAGTIEGRITNSITGEGIPAVNMTLRMLSASIPPLPYTRTFTDDQGAYRFDGLKEGQYALMFTRSGFGLPATSPDEVPVRVSSDSTARFDGTLAPWPALSGRVIDPEGRPVSGIHVKLSRDLDDDAVTDDQGAFRFEKLKPDSYTLLATPDPPLAPTFFPSVLGRADAQTIQVQAGVDLSGYHIQLRSAPAFKIRGLVLDAAGRPVAAAKVTLYQPSTERVGSRGSSPMNSPRPLEQAHVASGDDGTFEFSPVYAGDWRVRAESVVGYDDVHRRDLVRSGFSLANVSSRDVDRVEIRLNDPFAVDITSEGSARPQQSIGLVGLDSPGGGSDLLVSHRIENVFPGRYRVRAPGHLPGFYISEILLGGLNVIDQEFELNGPAVLKVVYKSDGGSVRGKVDGGTRNAVLLFPRGGDFPQMALCQIGGGFAFTDVPPGDYTAVAVHIPEDYWNWNPASYRYLASTGASVHVQASAATSVELRVSSQP